MKRIRVSAINGVAKKAALGAMLFSSVVMFATTPNRNTRTENPPQAEVVSREGADALKAITFPGFQQNTTVPTVHNQKLDEKLLKLTDPEYIQDTRDYLDTEYKTSGSYLGSVYIQQAIDYNMFLEFLNGNINILKNFEGEYKVTPESRPEGTYYDVARMCYDEKTKAKLADLNNKVGKWVEENYFSIYSDAFKTDHPLDYDETSQMFENFFSTLDNYEFSPGYKMFETLNLDYVKNGIKEEMAQSKAPVAQKKMDILAIQVNYMDDILFWDLSKMYYEPTSNGNSKMYKLFRIFMQAVKPSFN